MECYGNFLYEPCRQRKTCDKEGECRLHTNETKGPCTCKYKKHCHTSRQHVTTKYATQIEECPFYMMFEAKGE